MHAVPSAVTLIALLALSADAQAADRSKTPIPCSAGVQALKPVSLVTLFQKSKGKYKLERKAGCLIDVGGHEVPAVLLELPAYTEP